MVGDDDDDMSQSRQHTHEMGDLWGLSELLIVGIGVGFDEFGGGVAERPGGAGCVCVRTRGTRTHNTMRRTIIEDV